MGGIACWKKIIDGNNALTWKVNCMAETFRIQGATAPEKMESLTYADVEEFEEAAEALAKVAARLQSKVGGDELRLPKAT